MTLLKVQQAMAKVDARELIVQGAVSITHGAMEAFAQKGIEMSSNDQNDLIKRLMMVSCADSPEPPAVVSSKKKSDNKREDNANDAIEKA